MDRCGAGASDRKTGGAPRSIRRSPFALLWCVAAAAAFAATHDAGRAAGSGESSERMPLAQKSLLLDAALAGDTVIAVGERGHVLLSDDGGRSWDQVVVPSRAMLTAVAFADARRGCAVGHDAVILCTDDAGRSWSLVHEAPEDGRPLLDVRFLGSSVGLAVGAYGYLLRTEDGGRTWREERLALVDTDEDGSGGLADFHLNHIARSAEGRLYVAAEAGTIYRSDDEGRSWRTLPSPYEGSFFGALPLKNDDLLLFGLRGHLYRSEDGGEAWSPIELPTDALLSDGFLAPGGHVVITGLEGTLLVSRDGGRSFELLARPDRRGIWTGLALSDGSLLLVGELGTELTRLNEDGPPSD